METTTTTTISTMSTGATINLSELPEKIRKSFRNPSPIRLFREREYNLYRVSLACPIEPPERNRIYRLIKPRIEQGRMRLRALLLLRQERVVVSRRRRRRGVPSITCRRRNPRRRRRRNLHSLLRQRRRALARHPRRLRKFLLPPTRVHLRWRR